jgi:hypothetical protein
MSARIRRALLISCIPLALLLAYLLADSVRKYLLEPLIYAYRIERILYEALPQALWWGIFILVLAAIALRSLRIDPAPPTRTRTSSGARPSRARAWRQAIAGTARGHYSRWLLAREIADLALHIVAHQERITHAQARIQLKSGAITLPPGIQEYIQMGLDSPSFRHYTDFLAYMRSTRHSAPLELDPEVVIEYLENRIYDGGSP